MIPAHIISTQKFQVPVVADKNLREKHWTPAMIELLGRPYGVKKTGVRLYEPSRVMYVIQTPAFQECLRNFLLERINGVILPHTDELIHQTCQLVNSGNAMVKGSGVGRLKSLFYNLKASFIEWAFRSGLVVDYGVEFPLPETMSLTLVQFTVKSPVGEDFFWHQPMRNLHYLPQTIPIKPARPSTSDGITTHGTLDALIPKLEWSILSLLLHTRLKEL